MPAGFVRWTAPLVTGDVHEVTHKQVRGFDADVEQVSATGGFIVRNACFDQMSMTVEFMFDLQVDPALVREMDLVVGEEIAIRHLGTRQKGDTTNP